MAAPKTAPTAANPNAEQIARNAIDAQLSAAGWIVQSRADLNFNAAPAIAVCEYPTDVGPAITSSSSTNNPSALSKLNLRTGDTSSLASKLGTEKRPSPSSFRTKTS
jgi:hypothetical protein